MNVVLLPNAESIPVSTPPRSRASSKDAKEEPLTQQFTVTPKDYRVPHVMEHQQAYWDQWMNQSVPNLLDDCEKGLLSSTKEGFDPAPYQGVTEYIEKHQGTTRLNPKYYEESDAVRLKGSLWKNDHEKAREKTTWFNASAARGQKKKGVD